MQGLLTKVVFQHFLEATLALMVCSTTLAAGAFGGVLPNIVWTLPGIGALEALTACRAISAPVTAQSLLDYLFVVLRINRETNLCINKMHQMKKNRINKKILLKIFQPIGYHFDEDHKPVQNHVTQTNRVIISSTFFLATFLIYGSLYLVISLIIGSSMMR
jgi:hypothetical protein